MAEATALMVDGRFRHLPVVNDAGHVVGLVSMRDLMAYTSLRLRGGGFGDTDDLDPAEVIATIHRLRTGAPETAACVRPAATWCPSESVFTNLGRPSTEVIVICKDPTLVPGTRTAPSTSAGL